jgi:hypothetical protein
MPIASFSVDRVLGLRTISGWFVVGRSVACATWLLDWPVGGRLDVWFAAARSVTHSGSVLDLRGRQPIWVNPVTAIVLAVLGSVQ